MQLSEKASKNLPLNLYIRRMISNRRHIVWTMLAAFLLVIAHDLTPHSHSFWGSSPAFSSEHVLCEDSGIFHSLVELDLGVDHLEHFAPASGLSFSKKEIQKCVSSFRLRLPEQFIVLNLSALTSFHPEPILHPVFLSTQYLFRGPPASEA